MDANVISVSFLGFLPFLKQLLHCTSAWLHSCIQEKLVVVLNGLALEIIPLPTEGLLLVLWEKVLVLSRLEAQHIDATQLMSLHTLVFNHLEEEFEKDRVSIFCRAHLLFCDPSIRFCLFYDHGRSVETISCPRSWHDHPLSLTHSDQYKISPARHGHFGQDSVTLFMARRCKFQVSIPYSMVRNDSMFN